MANRLSCCAAPRAALVALLLAGALALKGG